MINNKDYKILITGANGFIGKNLYYFLLDKGFNILCADVDTTNDELNKYLLEADFIFNFAGINRPKTTDEFYKGNSDYLQNIINILLSNNKKTSIMLSSSIQVEKDNDYGKSKLKAENDLIEYKNKSNSNIYIYRFPNVFGKWSRPNYNSFVATCCYNLSRGIEVNIDNRDNKLVLLYIDDLCNEMLKILSNEFENKIKTDYNYYEIENIHTTTVGEVYDIIKSFNDRKLDFYLPFQKKNSLEKKLYATYLSFLDKDNFSYPLIMNKDNRGSFTEILKTEDYGQFSVNIIKPGITKGNHYHNTKNEKYLCVRGKVCIKFRLPFNDEIIEYINSDEELKIVDIPCGYTHSIKNIGNEDAVVFMWANEIYDKENPDTICINVE